MLSNASLIPIDTTHIGVLVYSACAIASRTVARAAKMICPFIPQCRLGCRIDYSHGCSLFARIRVSNFMSVLSPGMCLYVVWFKFTYGLEAPPLPLQHFASRYQTAPTT
jgi:hypothetical protein